MRLLVGDQPVLGAARDDEQLALPHVDRAVRSSTRRLPFLEEPVVRLGVRVPDELAFDFATWIFVSL